MLQKFFENTLQTTFIKSLIYNTALPIYRTVRDGDTLIEGFNYIYKNKVIECTKTGKLILHDEDENVLENMEVGQYVSSNSSNICSFKLIKYYNFGVEETNISMRHKCHNTYYDGETHKFLGDYLRCLRDIYNVDLMGLYNCFNYTVIKEIYLHSKASDGKYYTLRINDDYKEILIPIKFNQVYTIAVDVPDNLMVMPVLYSDESGFIRESGAETLITENLSGFDLKILNGISFKTPKTYSFDTTDGNLYKYEKYLKLLIQIPATCDSSIVVLEGDYTKDTRGFIQVDEQRIDDIDPHIFSDIMKIYNPSLLLMNDKTFYAYSDTLIQYLSHNAITSREIITDNIKRVQQQMQIIQPDITKKENKAIMDNIESAFESSGESIDYNDYARRSGTIDYNYGIWTNQLRYLLYKDFYYYAPDKYAKNDVLGFVDTNVEKYLNAVGGIK